MTRLTNIRTTPELPESETMGGKMGGTAFKGARELGLPRVPASWLLAILLGAGGTPAFAQQETTACAPVIARVVSLQGTVEVQRAGTATWHGIRRLDTSICAGDRLRTAPSSRAALYVQPETLVRLDQNTTLTLQHSTDEISVEFSTDEVSRVACSEQACGAGYFITRFPKKFKVKTPHMNAAVEGTEFMVAVGRDSTQLTVLEGKVASESVTTGDRKLVEAGHGLASGESGSGVISATFKPEDAVQWVLRYPPLSDGTEASRAEELLRAGRVDAALAEIDSVLNSNPDDSNALALRSVIQVAKNDKAGALESANRSASANAGNYRAWIAKSYSQQAAFDLEAALDSSRQAASLQPGSALAHARVAEMQLSLGNSREAEISARTAIAGDPAESHAHTILGFAHLAQIDTKRAREDFQAAIERDSFSSLPRLGLGLAMIRDGELVAGREELEIAVALDPLNSLLRSYIGKAYYEENNRARDELARMQLDLAKQLDPRDPTPYFYEAILLHSQNQPIAAIDALGESIEKNDNRAVYRSRLQLDDDVAARSASLSAIFGELGFGKLAILESAKAISENPGNYSAHNLLASAYADLPRHDIARVSEVLQAQIRQPVSHSATLPLLGVDNLTILRETGPTQLGSSEFTELFSSDGVRFDMDAISGSRETFGDQIQVSALSGTWSATIGQLHYETDGFLDNDAAEKDLYSVLIQNQIAPNTSIQVDAKRTEFSVEETFNRFDPDFPIPLTIKEVGNAFRVSGHTGTQSIGDWIWTAAYEDPRRFVQFEGFDVTDERSDTYSVEVQNLSQWRAFQAISGIGYIEKDSNSAIEGVNSRSNSGIAYLYGRWNSPNKRLGLDAGLSADWYLRQPSDIPNSVSRERVNPKVALTWSLRPGSTLRIAAFTAARRPFIGSQTIEPTQIAGFNQYFSGFEDLYGDVEGTVSSRAAFALDHAFSSELSAGFEIAGRSLDVPSVNLGRDFSWHESTGYAYLYKTFPSVGNSGWSAVATVEGELEVLERPQINGGPEGILDLETIRVPLRAGFFHGAGLTLRAQSTYIRQSGTFSAGIGFPRIETSDDAWIVDAAVDYQLPRRRGVVTFGVSNIGDEFIDLVESDVFNPRIATRQYAFLKLRLSF